MTLRQPNPNSLIYDPIVLMDQFKDHLYRIDNRDAPSKLNNKYKQIYSELVVSNKNKRNKLFKTANSKTQNPIFSSRFHTTQRKVQSSAESRKILFKRVSPKKEESLQTEGGQCSGIREGMMSLVSSHKKQGEKDPETSICNDLLNFISQGRAKSAVYKKKDVNPQFVELEQKIMMENMFKERLEEEIGSLKHSFSQLRKDLETARGGMCLERNRENKYKEVSYLSSSVQQQTDHVMINNSRDYREMARKQEETIGNLKKYSSNLRNENQEHKVKYLCGNKTLVKQRPLTYNQRNSQEDFRANHPPVLGRNHLRFMDNMERVLDLLHIKEPDYEELKTTVCTKVRNLNPINIDLLDEDRARKIANLYRFEDRFDIRLESASQIIIKIFHHLVERNESKEKLITELNCLKEDYDKEQKEYSCKAWVYLEDCAKEGSSSIGKQQLSKLQAISNNSKLLIKLVNVLYLVLSKFRYMFKASLSMNLEKKNFSDYLSQIDKTFEDGLYFHGFQSEFAKSLTAMHPVHHDHVNLTEFLDIMQVGFPLVHPHKLRDLANICFNDIRFGLILRKSWVMEDLKALTGRNQQAFEAFLEDLKKECEDIYHRKLIKLKLLFVNCLRSVYLSKAENIIISSHGTPENSLFLPATKAAKRISEASDSTESDRHIKALLDPNASESSCQNWAPIQGDPRTIAIKLGKMRNQTCAKFKILNFNVEGNSYANKIQKFQRNLKLTKNLVLKEALNYE